MSTVGDCEAAMKNADIDDDALLRMFHSCNDPIKLVLSAVDSNNERAVRLLVAEKFDFSHIDEYECTLLHHAYEHASLRIVDMLLAAGLSGDALDKFGSPPWHYAADNEDESVMAHLIASGVDVNAANACGDSLAHRAAENENEKVLAMLIAADADVSVRNDRGNSACHVAAEKLNSAVLALLVPLCDVNAANNDGSTPCMWAAGAGNSAALELLIGAGANLLAVANDGRTALSMAVHRMDEKSVEMLIDANADVNIVDQSDNTTAMHLAVMWCNDRLLGKLLAANANVNVTDVNGQTPCHMFWQAADPRGDGAVRSMAMLIAAGADVDVEDVDGDTPLHCAARVGFSDCMALLLQAGADVGARNNTDQSPLHQAKNASAAAMLVGAKADIDAVDSNGFTACHYAWDRPLVLSFLISAGANVHATCKRGQTALHGAASNRGSIEAMLILIGAKLNVNQVDNNGNCAGHLAAREGCVENLKLLLERGARINKRNKAGETMLFVAAKAGHVDAVDLLIAAGAALNVRNDKLLSPFDLGLRYCVEIAARLLRAGASPHDVGPDGCSVCHFAARSQVHAVQSLRLVVDAGADVHAINDFGASVAHGASAAAFPLLRSLGVNLNRVDDDGNTPCHAARDSAALVALFGFGATMTAKNNAGATPYETFLAKEVSAKREHALLTFVAAGLGFGVQTRLRRPKISAIVVAGGGLVSDQVDAVALLAQVDAALTRVVARQKQLFRARALEVCIGLQSLRLSALELCEILAHMFAPLESMVPFAFAWRVVTKVKHFKR